jgi:hypothetical protein
MFVVNLLQDTTAFERGNFPAWQAHSTTPTRCEHRLAGDRRDSVKEGQCYLVIYICFISMFNIPPVSPAPPAPAVLS